jgi:hypothetical protein
VFVICCSSCCGLSRGVDLCCAFVVCWSVLSNGVCCFWLLFVVISSCVFFSSFLVIGLLIVCCVTGFCSGISCSPFLTLSPDVILSGGLCVLTVLEHLKVSGVCGIGVYVDVLIVDVSAVGVRNGY